MPTRALLLSILLLVSAHALAAEPAGPRQEALCAAAVARAEQRHPQVPHGLMLTIAKVESGRATATGVQPWPWTIDADGEGLFFASKDGAVAWARDALLRSSVRFMDVGCMQVDLQMHPDAFASLEDAFDPAMNADYAARFLTALHAGPARGNWYVAIGMYHSQTPALAADYRDAVAAVGLGLRPFALGRGVGPHRARMRVVLATGAVTMLGVHAQPARVHRTLSACRIAAVLGTYLRAPPRCGRG